MIQVEEKTVRVPKARWASRASLDLSKKHGGFIVDRADFD